MSSNNLRGAANVSGNAMNSVYNILRECSIEHLKRMWEKADPYTPYGALLRHQINVALERGWYKNDSKSTDVDQFSEAH